jgi:hypothetical protein
MVRCGCNAASATTCDAIVLCVAANLGPGLRYDSVNGVLAVRISGDADNAASFGSDGGVYVPGTGASPDPASGRRTIAGLPARAAGASSTGGGSMTPFGSPDGLEYGIANRLDILNISTFALADGVAVARWEGPDSALSNRTDNPSGIANKLISSVTLPSLLVDAGARTTPTGRNSGAPASLLSPDGGWFGFYARNYTPVTLADALHQIAARSVAYLAIYAGVTQTELEGFISGAMNAVIQASAQDWTLVGVPGYMDDGSGDLIVSPFATWVADVAGAGMTPVVDLFDDASGGNVITPAEVVATGAQWVRFAATEVNGGTSFARIQTFIDAGLQVYVQVRSSRQFEVAQAYAIGCRAVSSDNPVYSRGARGEAGDLDYRKTTVIPGLITRTMVEGGLTRQTNTGSAASDIGWARQSADGRYFSAQFGWVGGLGAHLHSQLLGEICPYEVTSNYRLAFRCRVDPTQATAPAGAAPKLGIFFNAPTDRDITYYEPNAAPTYINGYWATIRVGTNNPGLVVLGKFNDGNFTVLNDTSIDFPSITIGNWIYFWVTTTSSSITLEVGHTGPVQSLTVADSDHRGPYAFYGWEDDYLPPADNAGFAHGYSAHELFASGQPMYEDLS